MPAIRDARTEGFTIGKLSDLTGVNIETIRYYEKIGLRWSSLWSSWPGLHLPGGTKPHAGLKRHVSPLPHTRRV